MAILHRRRSANYWPGFVDALAALLMVMVFVVLIFVIGQFALTDALGGRDRALARLNAELSTLAQTLSLETAARESAQATLGELRASLRASEREREQVLTQLGASEAALAQAETALEESRDEAAQLVADVTALRELKAELERDAAQLVSERDRSEEALSHQAEVSDRALAQVELLNRQLQAVRDQLAELNHALAAAEAAVVERDMQIDELGRELNIALAARVQELNRFRSEFFGRLREVLDERDDVEIVGDRFVFANEVLFPSASDEITDEGRERLAQLAATLDEIAATIPDDLPWVLQVVGHTDRRPIATARFPSNWELSTARALAIVRILREQGVPPERLAATGHGQYHPIDPRDTAEAYARNRRIELKLTSR